MRCTGISESEFRIRRKSACQCPRPEAKTVQHHSISCSNCCNSHTVPFGMGVPWFVCPSFEFSNNRLYLASVGQFRPSFGTLCSQPLGIAASWIGDTDAVGGGYGTRTSAPLFQVLSSSSANIRLNARAQSRRIALVEELKSAFLCSKKLVEPFNQPLGFEHWQCSFCSVYNLELCTTTLSLDNSFKTPSL